MKLFSCCANISYTIPEPGNNLKPINSTASNRSKSSKQTRNRPRPSARRRHDNDEAPWIRWLDRVVHQSTSQLCLIRGFVQSVKIKTFRLIFLSFRPFGNAFMFHTKHITSKLKIGLFQKFSGKAFACLLKLTG